jgi:hypothetical protein
VQCAPVRGFYGVKDFARKIFLLSIAGRCARKRAPPSARKDKKISRKIL